MPEPLVCEDTSLSRLMDTVHETPDARILYQDTVRRGGVFGFFAREVHRVAYIGAGETVELPGLSGMPDRVGFDSADLAHDDDLMSLADLLAETPVAPVASVSPSAGFTFELPGLGGPAVDEVSPFAALLAEADADEVSVNVGRHRSADGLDFAAVLRQHTEDESAAPAEEIPAPQPGLAEVTPIGGRGSQARNRLELLVQLRQVGVPVSVNPGTDVQGLYQALDEILDQLPEPATLPNRPGQLLVIVGESGPALRAARATARLLRLPAGDIVVAGLAADDAGELRRINGRRQAARLRQEILEADLPGIVVVATDGSDPDDPWVPELLAALRADLTWAVVDARWKAEDCHGLLDRLGPVQALVVHAAELSASPASVWDLDLPLALLDERRPSTFVWLSLLSRLFGPRTRAHRATA